MILKYPIYAYAYEWLIEIKCTVFYKTWQCDRINLLVTIGKLQRSDRCLLSNLLFVLHRPMIYCETQ